MAIARLGLVRAAGQTQGLGRLQPGLEPPGCRHGLVIGDGAIAHQGGARIVHGQQDVAGPGQGEGAALVQLQVGGDVGPGGEQVEGARQIAGEQGLGAAEVVIDQAAGGIDRHVRKQLVGAIVATQ